MRSWRWILLALLSPFWAEPSSADIHYVATNGLNQTPFTNWNQAAQTIQAAINASTNGDTVLVTNGIYRGTGNRAITCSGKRIEVLSVNGAVNTIIDCETNSRGFIFDSAETPHTRLAGFTIRNGFGANGGGIYCKASPTIESCVIISNTSQSDGGGIWLDQVALQPRIIGCHIAWNTATVDGGGIKSVSPEAIIEACTIVSNTCWWSGGGVELGGTREVLRSCTISSNSAGSDGGGVTVVGYSMPLIESCEISSNHAAGKGGGIWSVGSPTISKSHILYNTASTFGGGMYSDYGRFTIINSVFYRNASQAGGAIDFNNYTFPALLLNSTFMSNSVAMDGASNGNGIYAMYGPLRITNCICWNGGGEVVGDTTLVGVDYSCIKGGFVGTSNKSANPLTLANCRLSAGSPCIDAGVSLAVPKDDMDGVPRPLDGNSDGVAAYDIGAYEFVNSAADSDHDGMPDAWEILYGLNPIADDSTQDADKEGFLNRDEYVGGTDPTNKYSVLAITAVELSGNSLKIDWQGGTVATQYLERCTTLSTNPIAWKAIFTNLPPTSPITNIVDSNTAIPNAFYRIRAAR